MVSEPGRGRDGDDDTLSGEPPAFSDESMRRIIYGDRRMVSDALSGRAPDIFTPDTRELETDLRKRRNLVPIVTALDAVVCLGAIVWYAYNWVTGQLPSRSEERRVGKECVQQCRLGGELSYQKQ